MPVLQENGFLSSPSEDGNNHETENHQTVPDTIEEITQIWGKLVQLEARTDNLIEIATTFKTVAEEKMYELLAKAKSEWMQEAQKRMLAVLEARLGPMERQSRKLADQVVALEKQSSEQARRLGKLEVLTGNRCTATIPREDLAEIMPKLRSRNQFGESASSSDYSRLLAPLNLKTCSRTVQHGPKTY